MSTQPRSPSEHYTEAEHYLAVAESAGVDEAVARLAATAALVHAVLAAAPRRARRTPPEPPRHVGGTRGTWGLPLGRDDEDGGQS